MMNLLGPRGLDRMTFPRSAKLKLIFHALTGGLAIQVAGITLGKQETQPPESRSMAVASVQIMSGQVINLNSPANNTPANSTKTVDPKNKLVIFY